MSLTLVTAPTEAEILALVSVADLKLNLRISHNKEDALISECILEAYAWLDGPYGWLNRAILTQTWVYTNPGFTRQIWTTDERGQPLAQNVPTNVIEIPLPPLQTLTGVDYVTGGATVTLDPSAYTVDKGSLLGTVTKVSGTSWPTIDAGTNISFRFTAGWGDAAAVKSQARGLIKAIRLLASDSFRNREDTYAEPRLVAVNRKIINGVEKTAGRYRIVNNHA